jgi:hypothetical protein
MMFSGEGFVRTPFQAIEVFESKFTQIPEMPSPD